MYLVEGVVSVDKNEIRKVLPWVSDGWSLPQPMQLDKGLDSWFEYGLEVILEILRDNKRKAEKGSHLTVVRILGATKSISEDKEFDLHVAVWLKSEVLEKLAPCLLDTAGSTGGNLYQAQNQAAVGGSTALQILRNLSELKSAQNLDWESQGSSQASNGPIETLPDLISHMVFSVTTEGPIHELWLHFRRPSEEDFYMVCIGAWRTTVKDDTLNLLRYLWAVLRWGMVNSEIALLMLSELYRMRSVHKSVANSHLSTNLMHHDDNIVL
jgi:hypothetical protein